MRRNHKHCARVENTMGLWTFVNIVNIREHWRPFLYILNLVFYFLFVHTHFSSLSIKTVFNF